MNRGRWLYERGVLIAMTSMALSLLPLRAAADGRVFDCPSNPACGVTVGGPVTCTDGRHVSAPFNCNSLCQNPSQDTGKRCATFDTNLCVEALCGSAGECGDVQPYLPDSCNDNSDCTIDTCDPCANNCSGACVHQPDLVAASSGPVTCADGRRVNFPFNCNDLCQNPSQDVGKRCATFDSNPCIEAVCGSAGECGNARAYVPASCNDNNTCTIDGCEVCANDGHGACVHPPDLNAPGCNLAPGEACTGGFQCTSTFCVDAVCCNRACDAPSETCNLPGSEGQCVVPAPVVSGRGILIVGCLLAAIGLGGLQHAVTRPRG